MNNSLSGKIVFIGLVYIVCGLPQRWVQDTGHNQPPPAFHRGIEREPSYSSGVLYLVACRDLVPWLSGVASVSTIHVYIRTCTNYCQRTNTGPRQPLSGVHA